MCIISSTYPLDGTRPRHCTTRMFDCARLPVHSMVKDTYAADQGYELDFTQRHHHEIYLGDPRRGKPENLKTVIRHPVRPTR